MIRTEHTTERVGVPLRDRRRRGTIYVLVLAVGANILIIGLAAIYLSRVRLRQIRGDSEMRQARLLAQSAVEQAVSLMNNYTGDWRQDFDNDVETSPLTLGGGQMSFILMDEDGSLDDDPIDPLWIHGIGRVGDTVWVERAKARVNQGLPLEFLRTAVHCRGNLTINPGFKLTVVGAPASTDAELVLGGTVAGDAEAFGLSGIGTVTGTFTVPSEKKGMPERSLFEDYIARATVLSYIGDVEHFVLSAGVNEYDGSGVNPDGVYYINTGGDDLSISEARLHGTLLVDVGSGLLSIDTCLMEPYRPDFPVLIVKGNAYYCFCSSTFPEGPPIVHNFNPTGAPYLGATDSDMSDTYSTGITGLVHIIGDLEVMNASFSRGVFVVDGNVTITGTLTKVIHDPTLMLNPPLGYTDDPNSTAMILSGGSWSRQPAPG